MRQRSKFAWTCSVSTAPSTLASPPSVNFETAYEVYVEGRHPLGVTLSDVRDSFLMEYCNCIANVAQFQCRYLELRKDWEALQNR